jgi:TonB family protein
MDSQMATPDVLKRLATVLLVLLLLMVAGLVLYPRFSLADVKKDRKKAAGLIAVEIARLQLRKIYVADFLDVSGTRTDKSCYFSSVFSTYLKEHAKNFEVLSRIDTQKFLGTAGISTANLRRPESLAKIGAATGADAILFGTLVLEKNHAALTFSLRDVSSGGELYQTQYQENVDSTFDGAFPAAAGPDGQLFYFPDFDGISSPKCVRCPPPEYTDAAKKARVTGTVLFSVIVTEQGKLKDARLIRSLEPSLERAAIDAMRKWSLNPAKDAAGNPVPVRVVIEVSFNLA